MSACTDSAKLPLAKRAYLPPSLTGLREEAFDSSHEVRSGQLKYFGELQDGGERGAVFTAFQEAYVFGVVATLEGKCFLSEVMLLPELNEDSRKRSLLRRALFVSSRHPQTGVCGQSINTSTKYSIPCISNYCLGDSFTSRVLEAV